MSGIQDDKKIEEEDDYEDQESIKLLSKANKILSEKQVSDESFKFFTQISTEVLMKIANQLSKEKAEKLMNYLSKQKISKKEEKLLKEQSKNNGKQSLNSQQNEKTQFFNPSAPVWTEDKSQNQDQNDNNPIILNQLLREHEDQQNIKSGRKDKKFRMDPSQYKFEELAKYHEKSNPFFPFYSIVSKIMYSYGDLLQNDESAVQMMHSQIEEILKAIFDKKLMQKLVKYSKQNSQNLYDLEDESITSKDKFVFPKATKTIKRCFNQYFQTIFAEQFKIYQRFRETYQGIKEEGGFYKNNKKGSGQNDSESSGDSSGDENDQMEYEEDQAEDHQLREMKEHFDRDDEEENNNQSNQNSRKLEESSLSSSKINKKTEVTQKKDILLFDDNQEEDDEEEEAQDGLEDNQEDIQDTLDTLNQIEKIASLDEEHKKDEVILPQNKPQNVGQTATTSNSLNNNGILKEQNGENSFSHFGDKLQINEEDRIRFNKERTDEMSNEEWNYFMNVRCTTFTSNGNRKLFVDFLNINKYNNQFSECLNVFVPFLSYCLCKIIGLVVEQILRSRENGYLKQATHFVTEREVQVFGNSIIERYINRAKRYILSKEKLIKAAFQQFTEEFLKFGYDKILCQEKPVAPKNQKKGSVQKIEGSKTNEKEEKQIQQDEQNIREQWKGMKNAYKKMWVERVISEKQIKKVIEEKTQNKEQRQALQDLLRMDSQQIQFINKYASYLYERVLEDMQKNWLQINYAQHFKNWFLNNDCQRTGQIKKAVINNLQNQTKDQKRKMMKFESILD
ncbi:hypothetical protein TTHERM_00464960 (macronuclear) [Tetrahymena thermophila SB210]|uniref:Uncharacterized protein n=1 Tax=Tetrahymena thermophila (strain SB210) TaxID=312017 RepID=I7M422_TETTS|nr:hypothetical protein TTHERM_00464960 [Tetrahymena thermophila SB210]EAS04748.4 hypothetical protein TTHERM_00464960 [Tetrahymena thermophila SB210]|eukprot:XP_001024993.4 hypothetical protein TTHERM_00464960 [Tetrahymena thermophila SB210]